MNDLTNLRALHFSEKRLDRVTQCLTGYVARGDLAGAIAHIRHRDSVVYQETIGLSDLASSTSMTDDSIFQIKSMTKPVVAVALMLLYEEGHFNLDTSVYDFIPELKNLKVCAGEYEDGALKVVDLEQHITLRHLVTHTAGIGGGSNRSDALAQDRRERAARYQNGAVAKTMQTVRDDVISAPLSYQPGTEWEYTPGGTEVGALLVETISGKRFDEFLEDKIFAPLGMNDTGFYVPPENRDRIVTVYTRNEETSSLAPIEGALPPHEPPVYPAPNGGLVSTVIDYGRFCDMLLNASTADGEQLLSPTTIAMFSMNHLPEKAKRYVADNVPLLNGYGCSLFSWVLTDVSKSGQYGSVGEFGWAGAYNTYFWIDPHESLYAILMSQQSPNNYPAILQEFKQAVYQALV